MPDGPMNPRQEDREDRPEPGQEVNRGDTVAEDAEQGEPTNPRDKELERKVTPGEVDREAQAADIQREQDQTAEEQRGKQEEREKQAEKEFEDGGKSQ